MDTLTISKQMADGLKRLASKRQKADTAATSAREDFLRAVEVARAEGATVEEIGPRVVAGRDRAVARREVDRGGESRVAVRLVLIRVVE
jgi:hypothetical protein